MDKDITNLVLLENLSRAIEENTAINRELLELLKTNNKHTENINDYVTVQLSAEQQAKDFLINTAANLVGNAIQVPTLIRI